MPFFQNPFIHSFEGNWLLGDRQHQPKFVVPGHSGRGAESVQITKAASYNLSGNDSEGDPKNILNIDISLHNFKNWNSLSFTITATSLAATTPEEIMGSLNNNSTFSTYFVCEINKDLLTIRQVHSANTMRFYVKNGQAEETLRFNLKSGVAEVPTYFNRHTIANARNFSDSSGQLIELDPTNNVDAAVINNAVNVQGVSLGLDSSAAKEDYELLAGRSGMYIFTKNTYVSNDITEKIEYHAGAKVGDLAKKTTYIYDGSDLIEVFEIPHTLESGDLITP